MYAVSQAYLDAMRRPVQRHRIRGTVCGVPFTEEHILSGSFSITGQCSDASNVQIGQVYTSELKITLLKNLGLSRYTIKGSEIVPFFGLRIITGAYEYIPLGIFTVSKASWAASGVEITAYDNMSKLDRAFTTETLIGTPYELMTLACESCGLELAMRKRDFAAFANGQRKLSLYADNDIQTWRDCVSWIAQAIGCNVFANRDGKIVLRAYGQNVVDTIDTEHRFTGSTFDDYETHYTGLSVVDAANQMTRYYSLPEDDGLTYNLGSNPFLQEDHDGTVEDMCRDILDSLGQIRYIPFKVDMIGNPAYDLMDVLCFEGGFADGTKISCITKYTFHYNAKYSAQGVGTNPELTSALSKSDKDISGLMAQVASITSSINRLIYDFNTGPLYVGQEEQTLGMLTYYISQSADVEGHFLMNYVASESTHVILRFYDQTVEELYSPVEVDIPEGEGHFGIPHAYLCRSVGIHAVYVTAQCFSGQLFIDTRGVFFTIDAGNFAEAVDDISMDVRDISMRQLLESNGPDQIWIVGIEDGKMLSSYRTYSENYKSNPTWTGAYTPGEAIDAALEFDGKWVLRANDVKYTLETEDQPWYFWILPDGTLLAQKGSDEATRVTLDTGVSAVSACQGYSSNFYVEQDQGLVAAYIKGGRPYYIQYVYDTQLEAKRWLTPELLMDEEVEDFRVHRLNDYRLGFELTTATRNIWVYTSRTYVAQAVPKEQDGISLSEKSMFLYAHKDTDLSIAYSNTISEDGLTLSIFVTKPVRYFYSWHDVLLMDEDSIPYDYVEDVLFEPNGDGAVITIKLKEPPKKLVTTVTVNPNNDASLQAEIVGCGYIKAPREVLTFDTTVYRYVTIPKEEAGIRNTGTSFTYEPITDRRLSVVKESAGIRNTDSGIRYSLVTDRELSVQLEEGTVRITSAGMNYEQVAPSPI